MTMERFAAEALTPDEAEREVAEKLSRELAHRLAQGEAVNVMLSGDESGAQYHLPATAAKLLVKILAEIARGNAVAVVGLTPELTVGEAAELLNLPLTRLVRLLDDRELPFHQVRIQRCIRLADLLAYQRKTLEDRKAILGEVVTLNQEMGLYD
jgi:excisionase family DNA binding protein